MILLLNIRTYIPGDFIFRLVTFKKLKYATFREHDIGYVKCKKLLLIYPKCVKMFVPTFEKLKINFSKIILTNGSPRICV